ncbi:MAG: hypothetical protein U0935_12345 [Pirellulales bacterium]
MKAMVEEVRHAMAAKNATGPMLTQARQDLPPGSRQPLNTFRGVGETTTAVLTSNVSATSLVATARGNGLITLAWLPQTLPTKGGDYG